LPLRLIRVDLRDLPDHRGVPALTTSPALYGIGACAVRYREAAGIIPYRLPVTWLAGAAIEGIARQIGYIDTVGYARVGAPAVYIERMIVNPYRALVIRRRAA
jgi:hypothetical protein